MWKQNLITVSPSIFMLKVSHINEAHFTVHVIISTFQVPFRSASKSLNKVRNLIGLSSQHQQIPWGKLPPQFRPRTAGLDPGNSKRQCWRGEDVFLIAILQIAKPAAVRLNNLSKMDKGVKTEVKIHSFGLSFYFFFLEKKGICLCIKPDSIMNWGMERLHQRWMV